MPHTRTQAEQLRMVLRNIQILLTTRVFHPSLYSVFVNHFYTEWANFLLAHQNDFNDSRIRREHTTRYKLAIQIEIAERIPASYLLRR